LTIISIEFKTIIRRWLKNKRDKCRLLFSVTSESERISFKLILEKYLSMHSYVLMLQTDEEDRFITESTMSEMEYAVPLKFLDEPGKLNEYTGQYGLPSLILLNDSGSILQKNQLLRQVKNDPAYSHIPVVVLGEKSTDEYVRQCYRAGASSYITKPSSIEETKKKIAMFFSYWFDVAEI
jgi:CheY-like chemotaxis protein